MRVLVFASVFQLTLAVCQGPHCTMEEQARTSIMQMKRSVQTKNLVTTGTDDIGFLTQMVEQVKAQVGDQLASEITPEVKQKIDDMIGWCGDIVKAIDVQFKEAQQSLDDKLQTLTNDRTETERRHKDAVDPDIDGTTMLPKGTDNVLLQCRSEEKAALIAWEECIVKLDACIDYYGGECDEIDEWYSFALSKAYRDQDRNGGTSGNDYICEFTAMDLATPAAPHHTDDWLDVAMKCASYESVFHEYEAKRGGWDAKKEHGGWHGAYKTYREKLEKCTKTDPTKCVVTGHECAGLYRAYLEKHMQCTEACSAARTDMCETGTAYRKQCDALDDWTTLYGYISSKEESNSEVTKMSEVDRIAEYNAVRKIQCLLENYLVGGNWNLTDVELENQCEKKEPYEDVIGTFQYKISEKDAQITNPWDCQRVKDDAEETTTNPVSFTGFQWSIGRHSDDYDKADWTTPAKLVGEPTSVTPPVFPFCTGDDLINFCEKHEECGSTDYEKMLNSFGDAEGFSHARLEGWSISDDAGIQTDCKAQFVSSLCIAPAVHKSAEVHRTLAGPGKFQVVWGNWETTTRSEETTATLAVNGIAKAIAKTHDRHEETDFECDGTTCDLSISTEDGAEIMLHYVRLKECHGEVMGPKP